MAKVPSNLPNGEEGERVRLRANSARTGSINRKMSPMMWVHVTWDDGYAHPKICHLHELVALPIDGSVKS